jgi:hypothetical protein
MASTSPLIAQFIVIVAVWSVMNYRPNCNSAINLRASMDDMSTALTYERCNVTPEVIICCRYLMPIRSSFGHRMIKFKASMMWNKLPQTLIDIRTCQAFKKNLKAYLTFNGITSM